MAGADGPTHHGAYDIAYMRCLPNLIVSAPMNEEELRNLMYTASRQKEAPFSIRYPRGKGVMPDWRTEFQELEIGKGRILREAEGLAILTLGTVGNFALEAAEELADEGINVTVVDMRFVKPLDEELIKSILENHHSIITVEDGCLMGGFGSAVLEFLADQDCSVRVKRLGIPDNVVEHGTQDELYGECGYDIRAITNTAKKLVLQTNIH